MENESLLYTNCSDGKACQRKGFTITWRIENFSFWWTDPFETPDELLSPVFTVKSMEGTRWRLKVVPKLRFSIALFLLRETEGDGPREITLDLELSFLNNIEAPLRLKNFTKITFSSKTTSPPLMVERYEVFEQEQNSYLPQDTLTVRCLMSNIRGQVLEAGECIARTRLEMQNEFHEMVLEGFSSLVPAQERFFHIRAKSGERPLISMNICLTEEGNIDIEGIVVDQRFARRCKCKLFILNSAGNREKCGSYVKLRSYREFFFFPINLTKKKLMSNKKLYLPNDVLTLQCKIVYLTGIRSQEIDTPEYRFQPFQYILPTAPDLENLAISPTGEELGELPTTLKNDLMFLYSDHLFCDIKLRTDTETFPAHKNVLSARSSVFKSMFTSDMKEKATDYIDIQDLSSDTVRRMLRYLYTDSVGSLEWENAKDLYIAADKYGILSLGERCASYLKRNFRVSNVCDILVLADMHQNSDLKKAAQEYILEYDMEVFLSEQWKCFIKIYSQLAAETMSMKYNQIGNQY